MRSFNASSAQKGMWLAQKMAPDSPNHPLFMWDVDGELDVAVMESTFRYVLTEAEVLRVTFVDDGDEVRLTARELGDWAPFYLDLSNEDDPEQAARDALSDLIREPFDLERDILFRMGVIKLEAARYLISIAYHHLVTDGFGSTGMLSRRLAEVYTALVSGQDVPKLPEPWDAEPFAKEQAEYLASDAFTEDQEFWRDYLTNAPAPAQLPRIPMSESMRSALAEPVSRVDRWAQQLGGAIGMVSRTLSVTHTEADIWAETAKSMGVWMSSLISSAAAVFLRHRCNLPEFMFLLVVANRSGTAAKNPGVAVNVVPVRVKVPLDATFSDIADAMVDETYEIFGHTACHYSEIQRASGTELSDRGSYGAAVNVVDFVDTIMFGEHQAGYLGATTGVFDELSVTISADGRPDGDLYIRLDAPKNLYTGAELRFIGAELIAYIRALMVADPEQPIGTLNVPSGPERDRLLTAPNETDAPLPGMTIPELFARQAAESPDSIALVSGTETVTYQSLDERSTQLAEALRLREIGQEAVVAIALPRSIDLVVAQLAVLKAGGAYLPLDPAQPIVRVKSVIADAAVRAVLTDAATIGLIPSSLDIPTLLLEDEIGAEITGAALGAPRLDNLAAVLYSFGSAGQATGVALTHGNLQRFVLDRRWQANGSITTLWHSPNTFDASVFEVWVPLVNGGRVVVAPQGELDARNLPGGVSTLWLSAGQFSAIATQPIPGLRDIWTGGDAVSAAVLSRARQANPDVTILSGYGPTETTVLATAHRLTEDDDGHNAVQIGRPLDNTSVYVLGPGLTPVPVGVTGELYVAGIGVARGYAGRSAQTATRFVACPFGASGQVMYRTGDRVRWGTDGKLEYVGQLGSEARIRGFRVDPAEIEEVLTGHSGVAQAIVVAKTDNSGQQRLVAYVVAGGGDSQVSSSDLRLYAADRLAEFMVPSVFVVLERLPLAANGKLDRAALPEPEFGGEYRAPRDDDERALAKAFADVLELDRVGIDDDFFDLGGNSLRAIRLVGLIRAELNIEVSIRTLFATRTVAAVSSMRKDLARSSRPTLRKRTKDGQVV
ncbi:MAG TPA: amino acid adenylation domain-containing protein [Pseudonocardiaceae bacterium]|nr:amino acid adenylation domain-containing protein [Pseudonocardiaceae bacterium]